MADDAGAPGGTEAGGTEAGRTEAGRTPPGALLADTVLVSNRGPLAFRMDGDRPVQAATGGGLAGSLLPLVEGTEAAWVACALGPADRLAVVEGRFALPGLALEPVLPDPATYAMAYDVVSNATLWFCHHHLFDAARRPRADRRWMEAWDAYREVNGLVAERVAEVAPPGGRVLVQDYHLTLVARALAHLRPDLAAVHFTHTPFADPAVLRMLPTAVGSELLDGLAAHRSCGFHSPRWAAAYRAGQAELGGRGDVPTFVAPLSVDPDRLRRSTADPAVAAALARIEDAVGGDDRQVIVRVDRMELSKNLLRGFWAFDDLLEHQPHLRERVVFVALAYPTRQGLADYLAYQAEVETTVARINERWATPGWTPVVLEVEDHYPRSLAALQRSDVLLVNPVRDGLNLVAMEGPLCNRRDGVLALSREAGAFDLLGHAALEVNPFDVSGTAAVLARALAMDDDERSARARALRAAVTAQRPEAWLAAQQEAAAPAS